MKFALLMLSACALSARAIKTPTRPPKAEDDLEGVHSKIASRRGLRGARSSTTTTACARNSTTTQPQPTPSTPFPLLATSVIFNEDSYQRALGRFNAQNHEVEVATHVRLRGAKVPNATGRKFDELDDQLDAVLKKFSQIDNPRSILNPENGVLGARRDSGLDGDFGGGGDDVLGNTGGGGAHVDQAARLAHSGPFFRDFENFGPLLVGDANENTEQNAEQNANDALDVEMEELAVGNVENWTGESTNIPSYDDWVALGNTPTGETSNGGLSSVTRGSFTNPELEPTLNSQMSRVATLAEGMFLDTQNALTRTLMMLGTANGVRTQAATSKLSLNRIMRKVNAEARAGDPDAIAMWRLIDEIVRAIEATRLTRLGRVRILQGMMVWTFFQNSLARSAHQVPAGLDEAQSVAVANAVQALQLGAQCAYANAAATNQAEAQAPNFLEFWQQMDEASTGAEQTAMFRPMWEEEYWQTPVDVVVIMMPSYNVDDDGRPRPILVVCAFSTTFRDLRQGTTWSRLLTSSAHRCFESTRLQHSGVDGRVPDGHTLDQHLLALGSEPNAISSVFGLVGHTTSTTSTTSSTTTTIAFMTNYGVKPFFMVAPPGSEHFATCKEHEVGPFDVVDTLAEGDVVRQAIHHLFNNGSPYVGAVGLAHLLFSDHDNWDMGATFES